MWGGRGPQALGKFLLAGFSGSEVAAWDAAAPTVASAVLLLRDGPDSFLAALTAEECGGLPPRDMDLQIQCLARGVPIPLPPFLRPSSKGPRKGSSSSAGSRGSRGAPNPKERDRDGTRLSAKAQAKLEAEEKKKKKAEEKAAK